MEQRLSVVTLGVADLERARRFYEALGWKRGNRHESVVFFQLNSIVLSLFSREALAEDTQVPAAGSGFGGIVLAYNARSREDVDAVLAEAERRSEEHTSELQSRLHLVCRLLLEKKKKQKSTKS